MSFDVRSRALIAFKVSRPATPLVVVVVVVPAFVMKLERILTVEPGIGRRSVEWLAGVGGRYSLLEVGAAWKFNLFGFGI